MAADLDAGIRFSRRHAAGSGTARPGLASSSLLPARWKMCGTAVLTDTPHFLDEFSLPNFPCSSSSIHI